MSTNKRRIAFSFAMFFSAEEIAVLEQEYQRIDSYIPSMYANFEEYVAGVMRVVFHEDLQRAIRTAKIKEVQHELA